MRIIAPAPRGQESGGPAPRKRRAAEALEGGLVDILAEGETRLYDLALPEARELFARTLLEIMLRREREAREDEMRGGTDAAA